MVKPAENAGSFHFITNPKESTAHINAGAEFLVPGGRRRKPRAGNKGQSSTASARAPKWSMEQFRQPALLPLPAPTQPTQPPRWAREAGRTSQHLRVPGTDADPLSPQEARLGCRLDASLRPPASQVRTNPAILSLSDLTTETVLPPGPSPEPGLPVPSLGLLTSPRGPTHTDAQSPKGNSHHSPSSPSSPAAAAEISNFYGPPSVSRPPSQPGSFLPSPACRSPFSSGGRAPGLGGFLPGHPGARPPAAGPAPPGVAAHSPLSAEACRVAPEVPSMTLMVPRLVTARMALSAVVGEAVQPIGVAAHAAVPAAPATRRPWPLPPPPPRSSPGQRPPQPQPPSSGLRSAQSHWEAAQ